MRRRLISTGVRAASLALLLGAGRLRAAEPATPAAPRPARNVILLIADGATPAAFALARWCKGAPLALDPYLAGAVRTYSAESPFTDSAPAATAFAAGCKTGEGVIGLAPVRIRMPGVARPAYAEPGGPVATVLEAARLSGRATGLIATAPIQHATPAGFSAHWADRNNFDVLGAQEVCAGLDVVLGGGAKFLKPSALGGSRADGRNLLAELSVRGYTVVTNRAQLLAAAGPRVWGVFATEHLANERDRPARRPHQPSLADMTRRALIWLNQDPDGFLLMIEGSKVDWAAHAQDPVGLVSELLAFDDAAAVALEFARREGRTLVMAVADHGTGGMTIGNEATAGQYGAFRLETLIGPLRAATRTAEGAAADLGATPSDRDVRAALAAYGVSDPADDDIRAVRQADGEGRIRVFGPILSRQIGLAWTTHGHTGEDTLLFSMGPGHPTGVIENTDVARITASALRLDLAAAQARLFVPAPRAFPGARLTLAPDPSAPTGLQVETRGRRILLPFDRDEWIERGKSTRMEGRVIWSPLPGVGPSSPDRVFVPAEAGRRAAAPAPEA